MIRSLPLKERLGRREGEGGGRREGREEGGRREEGGEGGGRERKGKGWEGREKEEKDTCDYFRLQRQTNSIIKHFKQHVVKYLAWK